ncbi:uncharacterized protein STEHIDRAFT_139630 [Stereum hirsutum FP-91666 SS1]|uniref:uncharacterized protein n=1 Tax=Stereum hirsutum (strain FP-91666) TaxID=721885 RepID=UPI000444A1C9|nr:uncharacterized protein STEHIDRAFT_139630 [Stereum hirsutum FP-91666 SS1]EIM86934.1 hypothetical protein STEHIDRAFT_139630 [Stereum hirsutum FP-91666 SS1]
MLSDPNDFWVATSNTRIAPLDIVSAQSGPQGLRDDIRRALDDEAEAMVLALSSIRSRRNALSFPCRLPSEVLARCFWFLVAADPPRSVSYLGWIRVLHVSAHFRHVALAEPTLWTEISFGLGLGWAERMVSLAKAAPLSIRENSGTFKPSRNEAIRKLVHDHIHHIRELIIEVDTNSLTDIVNIAEPAPILETLDLRFENVFSAITTEYKVIPTNFLNGSAPRLRKITLQGFQLPSTAFSLLLTVVSLSIKLPRYSDTPFQAQLPSCDTFFSMLEAATRLESLNLENCLPSTTGDSSTLTSFRARSISLPHLAKLRVNGLTADCAFVLRHLNLPLSTRLEVISQITQRDRDESPTPVDITSILFPALIPHTRGETSPRIRTLHISAGVPSYRHSVDVLAWETSGTQTDTGAPIFYHSPESATLSLKFEYPVYRHPPLTHIVTLFDLSDLRALDLSVSGEVLETDQWINALRPCTQLQYLKVTGESSSVIRFCCALLPAESVKAPSTAKSRGGGRGKRRKQKRGGAALRNSKAENLAVAGPSNAEVFLPNLISLDLHRVDFESFTPGHNEPFFDVLVTILSKRKAIGKPLQRLSLAECIVQEDWVTNLEEVVPRVEWDEDTGSMNEEDDEDDEEFEDRLYYGEESYDYYSDPYDNPLYDSELDDLALGW